MVAARHNDVHSAAWMDLHDMTVAVEVDGLRANETFEFDGRKVIDEMMKVPEMRAYVSRWFQPPVFDTPCTHHCQQHPRRP